MLPNLLFAEPETIESSPSRLRTRLKRHSSMKNFIPLASLLHRRSRNYHFLPQRGETFLFFSSFISFPFFFFLKKRASGEAVRPAVRCRDHERKREREGGRVEIVSLEYIQITGGESHRRFVGVPAIISQVALSRATSSILHSAG